ncbi:MAG TPA: protease inhibitor I9 family protein, partial [Thermomicrobiales bacterium]
MKTYAVRGLVSFLVVAVLATTLVGRPAATPPTLAQTAPDGKYIVVMKGLNRNDLLSQVFGLIQQFGLSPTHIYSTALDGFSDSLTTQQVDALARNPFVRFIVPDGHVTATAQTLPLGIDRIDADLNPIAAIDGTDTRVNLDVA